TRQLKLAIKSKYLRRKNHSDSEYRVIAHYVLSRSPTAFKPAFVGLFCYQEMPSFCQRNHAPHFFMAAKHSFPIAF
ncbi:hypothetical protein, partial [Pantoea agglomerans]|uniref:hypothetical protein n=1 Tax=Enterobacter agglomerans TaxID=549 RepID=UPI0019649BB8